MPTCRLPAPFLSIIVWRFQLNCTRPARPQELGLLGLRIQRMPAQDGVEFNSPAAYPYDLVASPSCHDVTPVRWGRVSIVCACADVDSEPRHVQSHP
jgi:hypothetical protein